MQRLTNYQTVFRHRHAPRSRWARSARCVPMPELICECNSYRYRIVKEQQALARDPRETAASSASSQNVLSLVGRVRRPADQESMLGFPGAATRTQPGLPFP